MYLIRSFILISKYRVSFEYLAIFSIIFITNYSISTGGYGVLYYIPALALMYKQRDFILLSITVLSMYVGLWDMVPIYRYGGDDMNVYLSGEIVKIEQYIGLGSVIKPMANFAVLVLFFNLLKKKLIDE